MLVKSLNIKISTGNSTWIVIKCQSLFLPYDRTLATSVHMSVHEPRTWGLPHTCTWPSPSQEHEWRESLYGPKVSKHTSSKTVVHLELFQY